VVRIFSTGCTSPSTSFKRGLIFIKVPKNAWASCSYGDNALDGKPVAIMVASIGMLGTARAQYHLRQTFVWLNMYPVNKPEVMVPFAQNSINEQGQVTDQKTKAKIRELLESLVAWTKRLRLNHEGAS
jgi:chromate reductase